MNTSRLHITLVHTQWFYVDAKREEKENRTLSPQKGEPNVMASASQLTLTGTDHEEDTEAP